MLTLKQAAESLGITPAALRMAIMRGRLKAVKVGNTWTVKPSELKKYASGPSRR